MINTLIVDASTELDLLKKEARKLLMTGGAIIRLSDSLTAADCEMLFARFHPAADRFNLAGEVMRQLSRSKKLSPERQSQLEEQGFN